MQNSVEEVKQYAMCENCEYEKYDCIMCSASKLNFELRELYRTLPIIGKFIKQYNCKHFLIAEK